MAALDPIAMAMDLVDPPPNQWAHDPAGWVTSVTRGHLWSKQVEIAQAVDAHRKVAVKACHGPGKTFTAANIVGWWEDVHPTGEAFTVTSAPTGSQVSNLLWRELRRVHRAGGLEGRIIGGNGVEDWKVGGDPIAIGRKPADHDPDAFQGIHDRYVLVVLDEACGIPRNLWVATDSIVTNENSRVLAIGNPTDPMSGFAEVCDGAPDDGTSGLSKLGWWVITISVFDTPNFTDERVPDEMAEVLTSRIWLEEFTTRYGKGSPLYVAKVLGEFPKDSADGVVPWSWIQRCRGEEATARIGPLRVPVELGVDVAGSETGDETVIAARQGMRAVGEPWRLQTRDSERIVDEVITAVRAVNATSVKVDWIGLGFGVAGSLRRRLPREVGWHVDVHDVVVSEAAAEPDKFVNIKAEMWWQVGREYSRNGSWDLSEVDEETQHELAAPRYREVNKRVQVESKDEVRKRLGRSTDNADAYLLAFYTPTGRTITESSYNDRRLHGRR